MILFLIRKRFVGQALLAVIIAAGLAFAVAAVPALVGRVNDHAGLLDSRQRSQIEDALARYERETTNQVVLLTVDGLDGDSIEGFSLRVAEAWKIGRADRDNGVLLVIAKNDKKMRIEVGYGLEGAIPDAVASRIIRDVMVPAFKAGQWFAGIAGGLDAIMKAAAGEYAPPKGDLGVGSTARSTFSTILTIIIFLILISTRTGRTLLFAAMLFGGRGGRGGGGFSGGGGSFGGGGSSGGW